VSARRYLVTLQIPVRAGDEIDAALQVREALQGADSRDSWPLCTVIHRSDSGVELSTVLDLQEFDRAEAVRFRSWPLPADPPTDAQITALRRVWLRQAPDTRGDYADFLKRVHLLAGGDGCILVEAAGMFLGIETDGYTHS
jgi:hypothetical protein